MRKVTLLRVWLLVWVVLFLASRGTATGQSQLAMPPLKSPSPKAPKFSVDSGGNLVEPGQETVSPSAPQNELEIPQIPKVFEGCWEGTISEPDSWEHVKGPHVAGWIPTTKRLCFKKTGDGPFTITFHDSKLDSEYASQMGYPASNYDEQTDLASTDGHNEVLLHSVASFDERGKILGLIPGSVTRISATADARCFVVDDGAALNVEASQVTRCSGSLGCNGQIWIRASWHAKFHKISNP